MSSKILVVDDEPDLKDLIVQRFRSQIRKGVYEFTFAGDGAEALKALETDPDIDIVLSDINMPRMDGLTLLAHLGELNLLLRTVIVSAYGDMSNIRTAMNRGAFDFVTKPIDFEDLRVTIEKTIADLAVLRVAIEQRAVAERAKENLSRYFAPSLVETLASTDDPFGPPREQTVAVLFVDIIGFTALSVRLTPKNVFDLLRVVLNRLAAEVFANGGTLDKYIGDGLMATFGTPDVGDQDAANALRCAFAMQRAMAEENRRLVGDIGERLRIAVGLHYGPVLLGNIGEERRLEFAVIGDTVNVANRLEEMARPLDAAIVVCDALVEAIKTENPGGLPEIDLLNNRGMMKLRGRDGELVVWTIDDVPAD